MFLQVVHVLKETGLTTEKFQNKQYHRDSQSDQKIRKKSPNFSKLAQKVSKSKKAKISITKLNLKALNIYIKPHLKLPI